MALCEEISDVLNYEPIGEPPPGNPPDVLYQERARALELTKKANATKRFLYLAVRNFLITNGRLLDTDLSDASNPDPETYNEVKPFSLQVSKMVNTALLDDTQNDALKKKARLFSVFGLLLAESRSDPLLGKTIKDLSPNLGDDVDKNHPVAAQFRRYMTIALAEFDERAGMYTKVYTELRDRTKSAPNGTDGKARFETRRVAELSRALIAEHIDENDALFDARFTRALATSLSGATEGRASVIDIDLPDLEAGTEADIISDNVRALSLIYFSAMLEELKFFAVMDKVVDQFMSGALPIKRGSAGDPLYLYHRNAQNRINEYERRGLYARSFGVAQGSVDEPLPNREFNDMWIRFLSAVSALGRETGITERRTVTSEQVFKSARDLAVNLSLHGYGLAHFAAIELQSIINNIKSTLSAPDILAAYGTRDVWQLVERVSYMYLGGSVNGVRQRTMATSGGNIIQWLADKAPNLAGTFRTLQVDAVVISHVERWLAVTGTPDSAVERYQEPVAIQTQRTIPDFSLPNGASAEDAVRDAMAKIPGVTIPNPIAQN
ncbi:MAG TPA: hypothetical protein VLM79_14175 [Kofleriaceae bacterium]|nr:hypothetical protein [Kofleriaceae bacterium]